ncbi:putative glucose transporter rco-3 [Hypsizygus marmoreus]|uniref:Glucose transporter rco-3 n=1 Tax=Hypsizygus marmoreus TaxID=39966 RepID=A0A369JFB5_HYPMA|nr:putative glucose transporter rco-3 [Hypsizygus marmoreus]
MGGGPGGTGDGVDSGSLFWAIVMSAFAAFGGILFGYDTGTIGGIIAMDDWLSVFGSFDETLGPYLPTNDQSLVVSILSAGTFFGALLAFPMGDIVGRKWGIIASCAIFSLGVGLQLDTNWATFVVGRVIAGFGVGLVSCLVPMYQSECSPKSVRGLIVGLYQLAITIGALLAAIVLNATKEQQSHSAWRTPIAVQFVWAAILSGGMFFLPESPRFLLKRGRDDAAKISLGRLLTKPKDSLEVEAEYAEISAALDADRALGGGSYVDCFRNTEAKNGLRTWTGILLQGWQQLTGINFIFYYGTVFFKSAGISNPFIITIICDVVNTVMTIFGIQLIDRVGRRRLLLIGAAGMCVCEFIVAIVGVTVGDIQADQSVNLPAQRVLIAFVCIYIAFFATSWGPVAWVVTGEIFPLNIRAKGMSLSVASNWLWNFGIGYATPYLVNPTTTGVNGVKAANLGVKVFFIWGSTCVGCLIFTYFFIPETKGLSLEQIDLLYRESTIIGSEAYRKQILATNETFVGHAKAAHTVEYVDDKEKV